MASLDLPGILHGARVTALYCKLPDAEVVVRLEESREAFQIGDEVTVTNWSIGGQP